MHQLISKSIVELYLLVAQSFKSYLSTTMDNPSSDWMVANFFIWTPVKNWSPLETTWTICLAPRIKSFIVDFEILIKPKNVFFQINLLLWSCLLECQEIGTFVIVKLIKQETIQQNLQYL